MLGRDWDFKLFGWTGTRSSLVGISGSLHSDMVLYMMYQLTVLYCLYRIFLYLCIILSPSDLIRFFYHILLYAVYFAYISEQGLLKVQLMFPVNMSSLFQSIKEWHKDYLNSGPEEFL